MPRPCSIPPCPSRGEVHVRVNSHVYARRGPVTGGVATHHGRRRFQPTSRLQSRVPARPPTIALYTSSHGFGHAVRCAILCRALLAACPELRIVARTAAPAWIFPPGVEVEPCIVDAGVVQPNSLDIDAEATLERYAGLVADEDGPGSRPRRPTCERSAPARSSRTCPRPRSRSPLGPASPASPWRTSPGTGSTSRSSRGVPEHAPLLAHLQGQYGQVVAAAAPAVPRWPDGVPGASRTCR